MDADLSECRDRERDRGVGFYADFDFKIEGTRPSDVGRWAAAGDLQPSADVPPPLVG